MLIAPLGLVFRAGGEAGGKPKLLDAVIAAILEGVLNYACAGKDLT